MARISKTSLILIALLASLASGCAASLGGNAARDLSNKENLQETVVAADDSDPIESEILAKIPSLDPGSESTVGEVSFVTGETFASASGLRCRIVTIMPGSDALATRGRTACEKDQSWFFSRDIFIDGF